MPQMPRNGSEGGGGGGGDGGGEGGGTGLGPGPGGGDCGGFFFFFFFFLASVVSIPRPNGMAASRPTINSASSPRRVGVADSARTRSSNRPVSTVDLPEHCVKSQVHHVLPGCQFTRGKFPLFSPMPTRDRQGKCAMRTLTSVLGA